MASRYKPIIRSTLPIEEEEEVSEETRIWRSAIGDRREVKEMSVITGLDYHPVTSDLLVTSNRILMYDIYMDHKKSFYNSSPVAKYGGSFRKSDGRLLVVGNQSGKMFIYDSISSKPLRELYDHKYHHTSAVKKCFFFSDHQILSCSDDKTVKLWDLADGSLVKEFKDKDSSAHDNFVRTACLFDFNHQNLLATGSHDTTVKVWDHRVEKSLTNTIDIGQPIESLVSRDHYLIAAANRSIIVYDLIASKVLKTLTNIHSKNITGLSCFQKSIFSSSLDGCMKIFSPSFQEILCIKHDACHLSSIAVDGNSIAVGTTDGLVVSRQLKSKFLSQSLDKSGYESEGAGEFKRSTAESCEKHYDVENVTVKRKKFIKPDLKPYDYALRKYRHFEALDAAMKVEDPAETVSLMQELIRRNRLQVALDKRLGTPELDQIFLFVIKYVRDLRFNRTLLDVTNALLDIYARHFMSSDQLKKHFTDLNDIMNQEAELIIQMKQIAGQLDMIMANMTTVTKTATAVS